jgi:hypothetical protein
VYIIALCSFLNRTAFFSLYICAVTDLTCRCKPRASCMVTWISHQPISPQLHVYKPASQTSRLSEHNTPYITLRLLLPTAYNITRLKAQALYKPHATPCQGRPLFKMIGMLWSPCSETSDGEPAMGTEL